MRVGGFHEWPMFLVSETPAIHLRKHVPFQTPTGDSPLHEQISERKMQLLKGPNRLEAMPIPPGYYAFPQVTFHLIPDCGCNG